MLNPVAHMLRPQVEWLIVLVFETTRMESRQIPKLL